LKFARSLKTTSNNYHRCGGWTWQLRAPHITGSHGNPVAGSATFSSPSSIVEPSFGVGNCSNKLSRTYTGKRYDMRAGKTRGRKIEWIFIVAEKSHSAHSPIARHLSLEIDRLPDVNWLTFIALTDQIFRINK